MAEIPGIINICNLPYRFVRVPKEDLGDNTFILIDTDGQRLAIDEDRPIEKRKHLLFNCITCELLEACGANFTDNDWSLLSDRIYDFIKFNPLDWILTPDTATFPEVITLGPTKWPVFYSDQFKSKKERGYCVYDAMYLQVHKKITGPQYKAWVLLHEVTHAMAWLVNVSWYNDEKRIRPLSQFLYDFILKNNLDWVKEG